MRGRKGNIFVHYIRENCGEDEGDEKNQEDEGDEEDEEDRKPGRGRLWVFPVSLVFPVFIVSLVFFLKHSVLPATLTGMRYRVAFAKSGQSDGGEPAIQPSAEFDANFSDGVIAEKVFVEALESEARHSNEVLDEDDAFLGMAAAEVWEYDVADARADEFEGALNRSDYVLEYDVVDSSVTEAVDTTDDAAREADADVEVGAGENTEDASESGSGVRSGDDGPAGMPTGDSSAGGLGRGELNDGDGLEDLTVMKANDRRLGLTNRGKTAPHDWAANTGPTRNPGRGVESDSASDEESTLAPEKHVGRR